MHTRVFQIPSHLAPPQCGPRQLVPQAPHRKWHSQMSGLVHTAYYFPSNWDLPREAVITTVRPIFLICTMLCSLQSALVSVIPLKLRTTAVDWVDWDR